MIVFMFRPSPQIPEPSVRAAQRCYDACAFNVEMHNQQVETGSVDLTWIFTQSVFMALNTILWSLSYPEIRQEHPREEVLHHISLAMKVIGVSARRWPGVESAAKLYENLICGCLKAYDSDVSFVVRSPSVSSKRASTGSSVRARSPLQMSRSSSANAPSLVGHRYSFGAEANVSEPSVFNEPPQASMPVEREPQPYPLPNEPYVYDPSQPTSTQPTPSQAPSTAYPASFQVPQASYSQQPPYQYPVADTTSTPTPTPETTQGSTQFNPNSAFNQIPAVVPGLENWDPDYAAATTTASHLTFPDAATDPMFYVGSIGDEYSQFYQQPSTNDMWKDRTLTQEEITELMESLAQNLPETATSANEAPAFYSGGMF